MLSMIVGMLFERQRGVNYEMRMCVSSDVISIYDVPVKRNTCVHVIMYAFSDIASFVFLVHFSQTVSAVEIFFMFFFCLFAPNTYVTIRSYR